MLIICGRVWQYDGHGALLWLRDDLLPHTFDTDEARQHTILVDCRTILHADRHAQDAPDDSTGKKKLPSLTFLPGEGFCVVGWIERTVDVSPRFRKVKHRADLGT